MTVDTASVAAGLWRATGGAADVLDRLVVQGPDHVLPSSFAVTAAASGAIAAATLAVADYAGIEGNVTVATGHAAAAVRSERHVRVLGQKGSSLWDPVAGDYPTADGWVRLHTNYPHHRRAALAVLGVPEERDVVEAAVREWKAGALEAAVVANGGCAAAMHTLDEWRLHNQGARVPEQPVLALGCVGAAPVRHGSLQGLRVLDLTRVIAGPVASRFLASWGADVLRVEAPDFVDLETAVIDVGFGKRSCALDLRVAADRSRFETLARHADVVVHGYRPGALAGLGYSTEALTALRPGLVIASLSAYGPLGPWAGRRGFDSLVQMSAGIAAAGARATGAHHPVPLPCQLLDHATGYLIALGVLRALRRQRDAGGSWTVQVSLARTAAWLAGLGRVDALDVAEPSADEVGRWCQTSATPWGDVRHVAPPGVIGDTMPRWVRPPSKPGADSPEW